MLRITAHKNHFPVSDAKIEAIRSEYTILMRAETEKNLDFKIIYDQELIKLTGKIGRDATVNYMKPFNTLKENMKKRRQKTKPKVPQDTENLVLSHRYTSNKISMYI